MNIRAEDCTFCEVMPAPRSAFDVSQPLEEQPMAIMPALGMLVPGYLLAVSNEHLTSFAQYDREVLRETDEALTRLEAELGPRFGQIFRLESGSDREALFCGSGGCIEHAHQHLVPAADVAEHIRDILPWQKLATYEDIVDLRGEPYIYFAYQGDHMVVPQPGLPGQWMRRQIAEVRQLPTWDWLLDPGHSNLETTISKLSGTSLGPLAMAAAGRMPAER